MSAVTELIAFTFEDSSMACRSAAFGAGCSLPAGARSKVPPSDSSAVPAGKSASRICPATVPLTETVPSGLIATWPGGT